MGAKARAGTLGTISGLACITWTSDPSDPMINEPDFERRDWVSSEFGHVEDKEALPPNMPEPRGMGFTIVAKVDADHASNTVTRRSRTGILVYLNCLLVNWWSKKQASIESSSFGVEFIVMKQCCEYLRGLRYKLCMMGKLCNQPSHIYGDNQSVLANMMMPDSMLKKKSQSIVYHFVHKGSARGEWRTAYVNMHDHLLSMRASNISHLHFSVSLCSSARCNA